MRSLVPRPERALDLACGPGANALALAAIIPEVTALDLNADFVRQVRRRARASRRRVRAVQGDMRTFRLDRPVDLVTCFFDALNHLPRREDLPRTLRAVHRALRPGGLFLFDVNTPHALKVIWPAMKGMWKGRGWFAVARGEYVEEGPAGAASGRGLFEIHWFHRTPAGHYSPSIESFSEVAWTDTEIRSALRAAGFLGVHCLKDPALGAHIGADSRGRRFYLARRK